MATDARTGRRRAGGNDPLTAVLFGVAAFLIVLALLAGQLPADHDQASARRVVVERRIYQTTIVETLPGSGSSSGAAVTQAVSNSTPAQSAAAAPVTHTS
jgi:hypothetical protein